MWGDAFPFNAIPAGRRRVAVRACSPDPTELRARIALNICSLRPQDLADGLAFADHHRAAQSIMNLRARTIAEAVKDGGGDVLRFDASRSGIGRLRIGRAMHSATLNAAPGKSGREDVSPVVSPRASPNAIRTR